MALKFVSQETAEEKHMFLVSSMGYKERVPNISHLSYMNLCILSPIFHGAQQGGLLHITIHFVPQTF